MKQIVTDYRTSEVTKAELGKLGFSVVLTKPIESLYDEVKGHSDMQLHIVNGKAICEPEVYEYYKAALKDIDVVCGGIHITGKYPYDIAYNTCVIGEYVICKAPHTAPEIIEEYNSLNYKIVDTKQGYAKCSLCVVDNESAITSDDGLYKQLTKIGLNILKIRPGYIHLGNMQGFIGGTSGLIKPNLITFNGDISTHPDYLNIKAFCKNSGVEILSLNCGELIDIGSFLSLF